LHAWGADAAQLSLTGGQELQKSPLSAFRRSRKSGSIRRCRIDAAYLEQFSHLFHGLRPLRLVVETRCEPVLKFLRQLLCNTGCELIAARVLPGDPSDVPRRVAGDAVRSSASPGQIGNLARQVQLDGADLGFWIDPTGERCVLVDERGKHVVGERLAKLLGRESAVLPASDALRCLAMLLVALSRSDLPLSAIVG
jgi:phosphomannomutase